jgi:CRP-like cAMP-binding protein
MFETFTKYLQEKRNFSPNEMDMILSVSVMKKVRKGQYLLEEGQVSSFSAFVVTGSFRLFRVGEDGQEHIMKFAIENWWISDYTSFMSGRPANCYIEALENSELIIFTKEKWEYLINLIPAFKQTIEQLTARNFEAHQNRIYSNISETGESRYENFVAAYPTLYNRVPLYMIASFLGLTRETLSRIRKQSGRKQPPVTQHLTK